MTINEFLDRKIPRRYNIILNALDDIPETLLYVNLSYTSACRHLREKDYEQLDTKWDVFYHNETGRRAQLTEV